MTTYVKVTLFSVSRSTGTPPLSETLQKFANLPLERRLRSETRLDTIEYRAANEHLPNAWCLDFAKSRGIGPGKMSDSEPVSDIGLDEKELFGEETAALYVPNKKWLLVLNNRYGVGPVQMAAYFNALDPINNQSNHCYEVRPMIDQAALKKMKSIKQFSSVEITASVGAFDCASEVGESVLDAAKRVTAHRVHLKFMANEKYQKGQALGFEAVRSFVDKILKNGEDIDTLRVKSTDSHAEAQDRVIDLIEHKIYRRFSVEDLNIVSHRYTYESKIDMLRRACRGWLDTLS